MKSTTAAAIAAAVLLAIVVARLGDEAVRTIAPITDALGAEHIEGRCPTFTTWRVYSVADKWNSPVWYGCT